MIGLFVPNRLVTVTFIEAEVEDVKLYNVEFTSYGVVGVSEWAEGHLEAIVYPWHIIDQVGQVDNAEGHVSECVQYKAKSMETKMCTCTVQTGKSKP